MKGAGAKRILSFLASLGKGKNPLEVVVGCAILFIAFYFLLWGILAARTSFSGQVLTASFSSAGGLSRGAGVAVNGVRIGSVSEIRLNPSGYSVDVMMAVDSRYRIPGDSVARIMTEGLIGDKFVDISIGRSDEPADRRAPLRSAHYRSIEEIIGDVIFKD